MEGHVLQVRGDAQSGQSLLARGQQEVEGAVDVEKR